MRRVGVISIWGAIILALLCIALASLPLGPAAAQEGADPLEEQTATIEDTDEPADETPNRVSIAFPEGQTCTVDEGATVRVADPDGTQVDLVDDDNVQITATATEVTIVGMGPNQNIVAEPVTGQEGKDPGFDPGDGTVVSSDDITCTADAAPPTTSEPPDAPTCPTGTSEVDSFTSDDPTPERLSVSEDDFQVLYTVEDEDETAGEESFRITVRGGGGAATQSDAVTRTPADGTLEVNAEGAGTFRLDVNARGVVFAITVCEGTDDGGGGGGEDEDLNCDDFDSQAEAQAEFEEDTSDPNNLDADDDQEACEDFPYGQLMDDGDDDDLPDTGGVPLTLLAGLCLVLASTALARAVREG